MELPFGIRRITTPLPTRPGHVHSYLLPGEDGWTLVDTGIGLPNAQEVWAESLDGAEVARIFVTHFHPDHVGAAADVAELTRAPVHQGALDYALGCARERKQFGRSIAEFQGLQFLLADMGMKVEAARQMTYAAAGRSERGDKDLTFFGAAAKCFASDVAMEVTTDAVQLLGGYGYTRDYPVERMMRDAKITQIYEGTNQVQRIVMARNLP